MKNLLHEDQTSTRHDKDLGGSLVGFSIVFGLIGVPGLFIAAFGLWLQYDQLIDAERDTARQFELLTDTVRQLRDQTEIEVTLNTRASSDRFFEVRDDLLYEAFLDGMESIDFASLSEDQERGIDGNGSSTLSVNVV